MSYNPGEPVGARKFFQLAYKLQMGLTFQDVLLEPQYSEIETRSNISLESYVTPLRKLRLPIIAANMDTICEHRMAIAMGLAGGMGVIHRYLSLDNQLLEVQTTHKELEKVCGVGHPPISAAIGVKDIDIDHIKRLVENGCQIIVVDVAHGHHILVELLLDKVKNLGLLASDGLPVEYIVGNVSTPDGVNYLFSKGADAVKVGIGSGSICSTRTVTGHGTPQLLATASAALQAYSYRKPIIADGGFKTSGDIVKALAVGANVIMTGYLLAGTEECPPKSINTVAGQSIYRGMSSSDSQKEFYGNDPDAPEGVVAHVKTKGPVTQVLITLAASIRSGLSYSGANSLDDFQKKASWLQVSQNAYMESLTI